MRRIIVGLEVKFYENQGTAPFDGLWGSILVDETLPDATYDRALDLETDSLLRDFGDFIRGRNGWEGVEGMEEQRISLQSEMTQWRKRFRVGIGRRLDELS